ncbi:MAG: hypothetical protein VKL39_06000 [Leptolyngbyaceae bacterium]|nr:hypothetical protein [Leptolyngbyaceae bacterium]
MRRQSLIRFGMMSLLSFLGVVLAMLAAPQSPLSPETVAPAAPRILFSQTWTLEAASAQRLEIPDLAQRVYESVPSIPLENDYVDAETGDVDVENTLVSRLIRYHLYVVRRSPVYRFDWKISLADYLGVSGHWIQGDEYPGAVELTTDPQRGDVEAINQLNRAQRDALVQELVNVFSTAEGRLPLIFR